ncbi:MAG: hypothetical protein AAB449_02460 [Patescibacteria group bacterium]
MEIDLKKETVQGMASTNVYLQEKGGKVHKIIGFEFYSDTLHSPAYLLGRFKFTENMARKLRDRLTEMLDDPGPKPKS